MGSDTEASTETHTQHTETAQTAAQLVVLAEVIAPYVATVQGRTAPSLESLIGQWLHAKHQRSQSPRTAKEYRAVLFDYRAEVQRAGLELDTANTQALGKLAQAWAARQRAHDGRPVSPATHNRRLAIVSSFYTFAKRHEGVNVAGEPLSNPVELVERARVQAYASAHALAFADVEARLAAIERGPGDLLGKRDYALLLVAIDTGRRLSELAAMRRGHIVLSQGRATITWPRTKGGKVMRDTLPAIATDALMDWLYAAYGATAATLAPDAPIWLSLGRGATAQATQPRRALSIHALANVYTKRLGTSKVHATRHTFAALMEQAGAKLTDIQARLGHANVATTGTYLKSLHDGENAYAEDVLALVGVGKAAASSRPRGTGARITRPLTRPLGRTRAR